MDAEQEVGDFAVESGVDLDVVCGVGLGVVQLVGLAGLYETFDGLYDFLLF